MVARTIPFKSRDKPEELPSISDEMQRQIEADQKDIKKQLRHAQQQLDLTNVYPGRRATPGLIGRGDNVLAKPFKYLHDGMSSDNSTTNPLLNCFEPYFEKITVTEAFLAAAYFLEKLFI